MDEVAAPAADVPVGEVPNLAGDEVSVLGVPTLAADEVLVLNLAADLLADLPPAAAAVLQAQTQASKAKKVMRLVSYSL